MDILMGQFADATLAALDDSELNDFETLMDAPDPEIFKWMTGAAPTPPEFDTPLFTRLKAFHTHAEPIHS
jgi:antitoxin CptB